MSAELEDALSKIRPHVSSSLPHQQAPAKLLTAVEATFMEQHTSSSAAAYFASILTALERTVDKEKGSEFILDGGAMLPAELYLLALVIPFVPIPVIRVNANTLLTITSVLWSPLNAQAPPLRSQLTVYEYVYHAMDKSQLEMPLPRQSFATILQLAMDSRPKVRRRAADLVCEVLKTPPSPLTHHPYSERVAEWVQTVLQEINSGPLARQKGKKDAAGDTVNTAIHFIAFLKPVLPYLPSSSLPSITALLLKLPRFGSPFLSQAVYEALFDLLVFSQDDDVLNSTSEITTSDVLKATLASPPSHSDNTLASAWSQLTGKAMCVLMVSSSQIRDREFLETWSAIFGFLQSNDSATRREAANALASMSDCITPALVEASTKSPNTSRAVIGQVIAELTKALTALAYAPAIPQVLRVIASLVANLHHRPGGPRTPTAAEQLALPLVTSVGQLRTNERFAHKESVDLVLRAAIAVMGPEVLLNVLPLNLMPEDRVAGQEPRAFLLPLLSVPHSGSLTHFVSYFVPLSERMFNLQQKAESEGREAEGKVWAVLISQIWAGLPGYCHATPNLREALTPQFCQMLTQILYNQPELRPPVLNALKLLVETNVQAASDLMTVEESSPQKTNPVTLSDEDATANLQFLRTQADSWLAVLFNVFNSVDRGAHGMVGNVISAWVSVADEQAMTKTCGKVIGLFKTNLAKSQDPKQSGPSSQSVVAVMQDILVLLIPKMPKSQAKTLFDMCLSAEVLASKDVGIQKRGYKLLSKLVNEDKIDVSVEEVFSKLEEYSERTASGAKKDRLALLEGLLQPLPRDSLHVIPLMTSEAILCTKEVAEKARTAAFGLLVAMGLKMKGGGIVKRSELDGMDADDTGSVNADIEEYITIVGAGLSGTSPHMVSATITALSRLIFEFQDELPHTLLDDLLTTIVGTLSSANREVVKSALGFVKLAIHTLPVELVRSQLPLIVPALLAWSHDHKNHFKVRVRHMFERLIRRFGWESVYSLVSEEEDAAKVLLNIKKRKDRAKRKKAQQQEAEDSDADVPAKQTRGDAFEDVLYGSESEIDSSDDEAEAPSQKARSGRQAKKGGLGLRMDADKPMDLLDGATSFLTAGDRRQRRPGEEAQKFKTEEDTGKMIIDASDSEAEVATEDQRLAGAAYQENLTSADGFTRGRNGRIKFNKDTKKRRRENEDQTSDVEMADAAPQPRKGRHSDKLGQEFKAKNAGGDVKRGKVDPYAYLPLSQAASRKKGRKSAPVTGKR